ncbi:MAG: GldG family protein [Parachlamydia sp.]|nr:GldG family protein [Parachlamydia sp.]
MLRITGYCDRLTVLPGENIHFYVNCEEPSYQAQLVRIRCGDINPEGPGLKEEEIDSKINGSYTGRTQTIHAGSYAKVPLSRDQHAGLSQLADGFCFETYLYPTLPGKGSQVIFDFFQDSHGFYLRMSQQGTLEARFGSTQLRTTQPLISHAWYRILCLFYRGRCYLVQQSLNKYHRHLFQAVSADTENAIQFPFRPITLAGSLNGKDSWNGKIDSPALMKLSALLDPAQLTSQLGEYWVKWNFSQEIPTIHIKDEGKLQLHGVLENLPTRGVTGYRYTGQETSWVTHPMHYSAIHFHDDDVYDAQWEVDFSLAVPEELKSGLYAMRLRISDQDEYLPFVVRPGKKRNKIALLFPTATYMAYANEHIMIDPAMGELINQRAIQINPYQLFLKQHREYGNSLYDVHSDGSGVHYSSRLRPMLNMRPKRLFGIGGGSSFLWQFNADTHITDWLEANDFEYDIVTDEDLEERGLSEIQDYRVLMTTTHPEYYSTKMLQAVDDYIHQGGRLMYMGGNGFYWRVAFHQYLPGVIEVRRTAGTRAWEIAPGEGTHSFNGEAGGLWRYHNRAPNKLCGVGFAAQGFDRSSYYKRTADADNPRAAFIFEGINDNILGDFGLIGGGAAGMEVDRYDLHLGSPRHALVVASSENHSSAHLVAIEDIYNNYLGVDGQQNSLVRADVSFFETPSGGAVFSTGSIAWSGALSHNRYENNISHITCNVLKRFLSPEPFTGEHGLHLVAAQTQTS